MPGHAGRGLEMKGSTRLLEQPLVGLGVCAAAGRTAAMHHRFEPPPSLSGAPPSPTRLPTPPRLLGHTGVDGRLGAKANPHLGADLE